jgi:hypothetical protein
VKRSLIPGAFEYARALFLWHEHPARLYHLGLNTKAAGIVVALAVMESRSWGWY